jgi:hypothetical protein
LEAQKKIKNKTIQKKTKFRHIEDMSWIKDWKPKNWKHRKIKGKTTKTDATTHDQDNTSVQFRIVGGISKGCNTNCGQWTTI